MTKYAEPCNDVVRVRVPSATSLALRETSQRTGAPVSKLIRDAVTWYLSATRINPQPAEKVTTK